MRVGEVGVLYVWFSGVCVCAGSLFSHLELSYWLTHVSLVKRSRGQLFQGTFRDTRNSDGNADDALLKFAKLDFICGACCPMVEMTWEDA